MKFFSLTRLKNYLIYQSTLFKNFLKKVSKNPYFLKI
ncbi:hypothetical protein HPOKI673_02410 [Helicobacter pylori oki673]|uniref:Uncharacterized protein n=1 Tax=Helicobacter pylori (strain India7) TaxID=907238 RepID=E8QG61_HELP7|nr:hypothetical protein HPIN_03715 [Helicobacter pylori India7]AHN39798.1 hypothetical protein HPOKI154_02420 [Helicobacter pylori oki154]AHN42700.1 hypothetical protein HPOKI673_02410 [Helicobacter pylori oki673]AHN44143.1 hypothetical protein HPOKI828_02405 [Helicobacter pylori oki828]EQL54385.1 hypothetical protein N404_01975 [Helicobacter pylori FD506]